MFILESDLSFIKRVVEVIKSSSPEDDLMRLEDHFGIWRYKTKRSSGPKRIMVNTDNFTALQADFALYCHFIINRVTPSRLKEAQESDNQLPDLIVDGTSSLRWRSEIYRTIECVFFSIFTAFLTDRGISWTSLSILGPDLVDSVFFNICMLDYEKRDDLIFCTEIVHELFQVVGDGENLYLAISDRFGSMANYKVTAINTQYSRREEIDLATVPLQKNSLLVFDRTKVMPQIFFISGTECVSLDNLSLEQKADSLNLLNLVADHLNDSKFKLSSDDFPNTYHFVEGTLSQAITRLKKAMRVAGMDDAIKFNLISKGMNGKASIYGLTCEPFIVFLSAPKSS